MGRLCPASVRAEAIGSQLRRERGEAYNDGEGGGWALWSEMDPVVQALAGDDGGGDAGGDPAEQQPAWM
ncbi:hypothetical protein JCM9534A_45240 [Catenuloplanes indicus JCM 9534]